ncbi:HD domain-containing protein [Mycoplasmopsis lipofaciens]|uniref:HD domain-containing protein n=1 Tax=Mycoplasmopsis lipofaciens TaxID=114884 RepID=UPI0004806CE7|nr:HD domain-containing protein [Mycoplasmopsis lipofaciens]
MSVWKAYKFAKKAHKGQFDKAGIPYINHPKYVASKLNDKDCKIVALLHDVVEDTEITLETIEEKFGKKIADAVNAMTKRENEDYIVYLNRVKANPIAKQVKLIDMYHNLDITRLKCFDTEDAKRRVRKYLKGIAYLLEI